jgi:hypothetical protein
MTFFAFQGLNGGKAINLAGSQEKQAVVEGFHGFATAAQAQANPNSVNVITRLQADAFIADAKAAQAEQAGPGEANANILNPATAVKAGTTGDVAAAKDVAEAAANATGINAIGDFFSTLGFAGTWVRVAKVAVGAVLVIVGLMKLTGTDEAVTTAVKGAVL